MVFVYFCFDKTTPVCLETWLDLVWKSCSWWWVFELLLAFSCRNLQTSLFLFRPHACLAFLVFVNNYWICDVIGILCSWELNLTLAHHLTSSLLKTQFLLKVRTCWFHTQWLGSVTVTLTRTQHLRGSGCLVSWFTKECILEHFGFSNWRSKTMRHKIELTMIEVLCSHCWHEFRQIFLVDSKLTLWNIRWLLVGWNIWVDRQIRVKVAWINFWTFELIEIALFTGFKIRQQSWLNALSRGLILDLTEYVLIQTSVNCLLTL